MGSLSEEDRLKRLQKLLTMWQRLRDRPSRPGEISDEVREEGLTDALMDVADPEIVAAVSEDREARVFCDLSYYVHYFPGRSTAYIEVVGDDRVLREGIRMAGHTYSENRNKSVSEHVKSCIAAELARLRDRRIDEARKKSPEDLLPDVLNWPRHNAAVLLENLTFEQLNGLRKLLTARTGSKSLRMHLRDEPEDELLWRIWYTAVLQARHPAIREIAEKTDRDVIILLGEEWGKPLPEGKSAAAPLHASYYLQLAELLRQRGYTIKRFESRRRLARLTGKSRSTIDRYLASGARVELLRAVAGRATVRLTFEAIQRSINAVRGEKRGPKNDV